MLLATNNRIKSKNRIKLAILKDLTKDSKDLYSKALYTIKQHFFEHKEYLNYLKVYHMLKSNNEYKSLPSNASQQALKQIDNVFKSFFGLLKVKNTKDHIPSDEVGHYKVIYTKIYLKVMENGYIRLSLPKTIKKQHNVNYLYFETPRHILTKEIKEVHILPHKPHYKISFIYCDGDRNYNRYQTEDIIIIDLGIDNLATIVTKYDKFLILDGKSLKSKKRYFNKKISALQSSIIKDKNSKEIENNPLFKKFNIWQLRKENYTKDYLHKTATKIINLAIKRGIKKIALGYYKEWKQENNLGKRNNEKFLSIPHSKLLQYVKYKVSQHKIKVNETEESYTYKCDALSLASIQKLEKYLSKRVKRGLFQLNISKLINANMNGALNILRKSVVCDYLIQEIATRRLIFQPVRVHIYSYKPSCKGNSSYN